MFGHGFFAQAASVSDAVVKIFVTSNSFDYYKPWQTLGISPATGSGCVIKGNKIITNAHVVQDNTYIQVKKFRDPKRYTARMEAIGSDCDLAILTVDDPTFFNGIQPLELGELPKLQDSVTVLGYPLGGDKLSITKGVISRIEVGAYSLSGRKLLAVQIDAALNPGNSGGAVIQDNKLVGIAMQVLQSGQNIGYIIPTPIISHFLDDLKDGHYDGFPILGMDYAPTENSALKKYYKVDQTQGGVLVTKVMPYSSAVGVLQEGDVILSIDNIDIGEDGTFAFRDDERLSLTHLITEKQTNDDINLKVIRDGSQKNVHVKLTSFIPLVPYPDYFENPPYFIFGGLVFTVLSSDLLKIWGNQWWEKAPVDFSYYLIGKGRLNLEERQELVVLLDVLPDSINAGYHQMDNEIIKTVNGQLFKSFKEFVQIIHKVEQTEKYTIIKTEANLPIILSNENIEQINQEIIRRNNIPHPYSSNVAGWLQPEKTKP